MISKSSSDWQDKYDNLEVRFEDKINGYAERLADGDLTEAEFRRAMENTIRDSYAQAWQLGASVADGTRAVLTDEERALIGREVSNELFYLRGFYTDLMSGALSEDYIINRATQYANALRGLYYGGMLGRTEDDLWDAYFVCNEDDESCQGCLDAADGSPYDPSDCPIPGAAVCDGFENCRCEIDLQPKDLTATERIAAEYADLDQSDIEWSARPHVRKRTHGGVLIT